MNAESQTSSIPPPRVTATEALVYVIDDQREWADELSSIVGRYGYRIRTGYDWQDLESLLASEQPDAILLDQHLGKVDTVSRLAQLRQMTRAAIIVITANNSEVDRVLGLETGADDFIVKPVSGREVIAWLRARLRRPSELPPEAPGWRFVEQTRSLFRPDGQPIHLTTAEFELLQALVRNQGQPVSREDLSKLAFGRAWRFGDRSVDNAIVVLRRKLGDERVDGCIRTVRGVGYVFVGFP
ncbi:response regulator transcription factor [Pseudoroseomonas ludipueritiae]|uniref:Response regulator transcription factor n=1 Tax=Pseudoroseomonas ludipueritiae TaxID=198093 RepID=A0ABR7R697_9PROT|nr:response regulator transcription factor [Pseudoroseomonas ludipueritiae]MBC9177231.1 response regulator transcription factor [Pseudoroseomonas ludipueritiae]MCG7362420.1 response regulator transcription factor [Roseomonas sp. ACRSG]